MVTFITNNNVRYFDDEMEINIILCKYLLEILTAIFHES